MKFEVPSNIGGFKLPKINVDTPNLASVYNRIVDGYESPDINIDISGPQELCNKIADESAKKYKKVLNDLKEDNKDIINEIQPMYPYIKDELKSEYEKYKSMSAPEVAVSIFKDLIGKNEESD